MKCLTMTKKNEKDKVRERYQKWAKKRTTTNASNADKSAALVEVMVLAACVDGILVEGEANALRAMIMSTPGFEALDREGLARAVDTISERVAKEGLERRFDSIAQTLGDDSALREEAFLLATAFVHFDGEVGDEEQSFLNELQRVLKISDEQASDIDATLGEFRGE
jgi:uncharacterized membrane protein YebE (DUF533 family)